jgi:plasmid stability protein
MLLVAAVHRDVSTLTVARCGGTRYDAYGVLSSEPCGDATMVKSVLFSLDKDLEERLRLRAASNSRSMNAELREIVRLALTPPPQMRTDRASLKKLASDIRALSEARRLTPAEDLLREGRDER